MRDAAGRRRARAPVGEVLSRGDDLPAVRHRSGVPVSVGDGAARSRLERLRASGPVPGAAARRLRLRVAQGRTRLGQRQRVAPVWRLVTADWRLATAEW